MTFSDRLYKLMHDNKIKAVDLSNSIGISTAALSKYLNDKISTPKSDVLFKIAKYFDVSMEYLISGELSVSNTSDHLYNKFMLLDSADRDEIEMLIDMKLKRYENQSSSSSKIGADKVG